MAGHPTDAEGDHNTLLHSPLNASWSKLAFQRAKLFVRALKYAFNNLRTVDRVSGFLVTVAYLLDTRPVRVPSKRRDTTGSDN
jgi:hypothetical protein